MQQDPVSQVRKDVILEQKHQDGILHIVVGIFMILSAILMSKGETEFSIVLIALVRPAMSLIRKQFTYPRIGYAELGDKQFKQSNAAVTIGIIIVLVAVGMIFVRRPWASPQWPSNFNPYVGMGFATGMLVLLIVLYFKEHSKSYLFYSAVLIAVVAVIWLAKLNRGEFWIALAGLGLIDFIIGITLLFRFISKHPEVKDEN